MVIKYDAIRAMLALKPVLDSLWFVPTSHLFSEILPKNQRHYFLDRSQNSPYSSVQNIKD